jgi:hypothetical protein
VSDAFWIRLKEVEPSGRMPHNSLRLGRRLDDGPDSPAEIALGALADPTAIDVERKLGSALYQDDAGIDGAQDNHQVIVPVFH